MKSALKPNYFEMFRVPSLTPESVPDDGEVNKELVLLHNMANHEGWKVFLARANQIMEDLDELVRGQMSAGADEASIGRSTVVKEITKDVIRRLLNIVNDAYDSIEAGGANRGKVVG
jgi:hypothetical protein